ncbi:MAG: STAS domain-containing protein [Leptospiraceae bacterium]|nr:STAS domain-containing protein [Leptospiraceae bacterium]
MSDDRIEYMLDERTTRTIVRVKGRLLLTNIDTVKKPLTDIIEKDNKELVFDMAALEHIDSSGIGLIIQMHRKAMAAGKAVRFTSLSSQVKSIFKSAGLDQMLDIADEIV